MYEWMYFWWYKNGSCVHLEATTLLLWWSYCTHTQQLLRHHCHRRSTPEHDVYEWRLYPNRAKKEIFNFRIHIYIVETCNFNVLLYAIHTDWLLLLTQCEYRMLYSQKVEPQSANYFCWIEYLIQFFFHPTTYISGDDVRLAKNSLPPNTFLLFLLMLFVIVSQRSFR